MLARSQHRACPTSSVAAHRYPCSYPSLKAAVRAREKATARSRLARRRRRGWLVPTRSVRLPDSCELHEGTTDALEGTMSPPPFAHSPSSRLPHTSRSTSSLDTILLSSPQPSRVASPTSTFAFSSLAGVWSSLKAAASVEIAGFVRGLSGGGGGAPRTGGDISRTDAARVGDKRGRAGEGSRTSRSDGGDRRGKRRRVAQPQDDEFLFDGGASPFVAFPVRVVS